MKNILVTGGAGFIGSAFIRYVLNTYPDKYFIVNLDLLTYAGSLESLEGKIPETNYKFVKGDISHTRLVEYLLRCYSIDTIVHFAAESHVDNSIHLPDSFVRTNVFGTFALLESARKVWLEEREVDRSTVRFHHISTDEVFGSLSPDDPPFKENTPYAPNSPYSSTKAGSDHLARCYYRTYGLPVTMSNCSNNYGAYQHPEKLIPKMISNSIEGKPLTIAGDGKHIRDWIHVDDHCEAVYQILLRSKEGERYNIGGNEEHTNFEIVNMLCDIMDELRPNSPFKPHSRLIKFVADRVGNDRRYAMDNTKIHSEIGWSPKYILEQGLEETVRWYLNNDAWVTLMNRKIEDTRRRFK